MENNYPEEFLKLFCNLSIKELKKMCKEYITYKFGNINITDDELNEEFEMLNFDDLKQTYFQLWTHQNNMKKNKCDGIKVFRDYIINEIMEKNKNIEKDTEDYYNRINEMLNEK